MEIAKLILEYLKVLIWPILLFGLVVWLRVPFRSLWKRLARESRQLDIEFGGQKISVKLAERVFEEAVDAITRSEPASVRNPMEIRTEVRTYLDILSRLNNEDMQIIASLPAVSAAVPNRIVDKLIFLGLVIHHDGYLRPTAIGQRISILVGPKADVDEALHKITQAM